MFKTRSFAPILVLLATLLGGLQVSWGQSSSTATFRAQINTNLTNNNARQITAEKLRSVLISSANAIDSIYTTLSLASNIGEYNAATGVAKITSSGATSTPTVTPLFPNGTYFDVTVSGTQTITGTTTAMAVGGKIIVRGSKWGYIPPGDLALSKALGLEGKLPPKNLANPAEFTTGSLMTSSGSIVANAGYVRSGKIPVTPGVVYSARGGGTLLTRYACYFNASNAVVPGGFDGVSNQNLTPPAGAVSVVVSFSSDDIASYQFEQSTSPTFFVPYNVSVTKNVVVPASDLQQDATRRLVADASISEWNKIIPITPKFIQKNLANPANFVSGKGRQANGTEFTNAGYFRTGLMPVVAGQTYSGKGGTDAMRYLTLYADNGTSVVAGGFDGTYTVSKTIPAGAAWAEATVPIADVSSFQFELGAAPTTFTPYGNHKTQYISVPAADLIQDASNRLITDSDRTTWNKITPLAPRFIQKNLANPANFVSGKGRQGNGSEFTNAGYFRTGLIPVVAGQTYAGKGGTDGMRYLCYFASNGTSVVAGGFDGTLTPTTTVPAGAAFAEVTVPIADITTFQFELGAVSTGFTPYANYLTYTISVPATDVVQDATRQFVSTTEKASWNTTASLTYLTARFKDLEYRGFLPPRSTVTTSPIEHKIPASVSKLRKMEADVVVGVFDGSVSTDMGYSAKYADAAYRPPLLTDQNLVADIELTLRRGKDSQRYRRYDSMSDPGGSTPTFTEVGTGVTDNNDHAWDYQWTTWPTAPNYNGLTRILTGSAPSVSFMVRDAHPRCDFIYRTDYLSSGALAVSIAGGNGILKVFNETSGTWVEANGFVFSAKEPDVIYSTTFATSANGAATGLRKSIYQKRLKFLRADPSNVSGSKQVTITSTDGGRICYWGIQYSRKVNMMIFVNMARGSHNINSLHAFDEWQIDYWKPDLIVYPLNTINEGAIVTGPTSTDSPVTFANRFKTYIQWMLAKPWNPDVVAYFSFAARNQGIVDQNDNVNHTYISGYGTATFFDYVDTTTDLLKTLETGRFAYINGFYEYYNTAKAVKEANGGFLYNIMHGPTGTIPTDPNSDYFTSDGTHQNTRGFEIGKRVIGPNFRF